MPDPEGAADAVAVAAAVGPVVGPVVATCVGDTLGLAFEPPQATATSASTASRLIVRRVAKDRSSSLPPEFPCNRLRRLSRAGCLLHRRVSVGAECQIMDALPGEAHFLATLGERL